MSRVGKKPIVIPQGVRVEVQGSRFTAVGPRGTVVQDFPPAMRVLVEEREVRVERPTDSNTHRALHGLTRTLLANAVTGVTEGFERVLEIVGTGYKAEVKPDGLLLQLGLSHPILFPKPPDITFETQDVAIRYGDQPLTRVIVRGVNKEQVGQVAATLRALRKPEPYQGKGIRYRGEYVRRKAGKAATGAAGGGKT
jgi:large subunit ribosomal protein L6